jgi:4'-phosphopantetheinyl transferase
MENVAAISLVDCRTVSDAAMERFVTWLDPSEAHRMGRFVRAERRRQFVVGRTVLRRSIGQLLQIPPEEVRLTDRSGAAPVLELTDTSDVGFSLSHSGPWVACAVSSISPLGLDVELIDASRNIDELAAQAFDAEQQLWLAARPAPHRLRDFYQLWSANEARFKLGATVAEEVYFTHPELSIVLCSARRLTHKPQLRLTTL